MTEPTDDRIHRLEARVDALEAEVVDLRESAGLAVSTLPPPPLPPPSGAPLSPPPEISAWPGEPRPLLVESETLLKWGGVALVVLAVGFAVSTAISRGWIGPELQLAGAVGVSLALIAAGLHLRETRPPWTHALCVGGVLGLFTTAASDLFLDQANDDVGFAFTVVAGVGGFGLAWFARSEWVVSAVLLGGTVGWLVISDHATETDFQPTLGWIAFLVAGTLLLSVDQGWFAARVVAHSVGLIAALGLAEELELDSERTTLLLAAAALAASLAWVPSIGDLRSEWQKFELQLAMLLGPWACIVVAASFDLEADTSLGLMGLAIAAATAAVAMLVRPGVQRAHLVSLMVSSSVALSIGVAFLLSTTAAFVALAVQSVGLLMLSRQMARSARLLANAAILGLLAGSFALGAMIEAWSDDAAIGDDIAHAAIIASIAAIGWLTANEQLRSLLSGTTLALVLVWLGSVLVHLPQGQAAVSASWAVVGVSVLVTAAVRKVPEFGAAGLAVLAVTVGKLLTVDLREVDALWRAALFFFVGMGFLRLGFLLPRLTGAVEDREPDRVSEVT